MDKNKWEDGHGSKLHAKSKNRKHNVMDIDAESKFLSDNESTLRMGKKSSILKMKEEWLTHSSVEVQKRILKRNTRKIQNFVNSLAVPSWYRGMSIFQKNSAASLLIAIRDDCAQRSVCRTMRCLASIGLDPLPTKRQLQIVLALCGGSDLALLWFLMEWLYQDSESDSYNINEQLILSSIAYLDLNITLRELDRILPARQAAKRETVKKSEQTLPRKFKKTIERKTSPYFEKLPEPIPRRSNYLGTEKERKAILDCYHSQFKGASEAIENEKNRWFQYYETDNEHCPTPCMVKEEISRLVSTFKSDMTKEANMRALCRHQGEIERLRDSFDTKLRTIVATKAQEVATKECSHKNIMKRLQSATENYRSEFYELTEAYRKHCNTTEVENGAQKHSTIDLKLNPSSTDHKVWLQQKSQLSDMDKHSSSLNDFSKISSEDNDFESKFFEVCQGQLPYKFDYHKIFNVKQKHEENLKVQPSLIDAVGSDITLPSNLVSDVNKVKVNKTEDVELKTNEVVENRETNHKKDQVDYGLDYYDPDDDELMDNMLKDALDIMKKDHKFVFASIPAAHRIPYLREWIRLRYGKTYSKKELDESFQQSKPIITSLIKVGLSVKLPSNYDIGKNLFTDYSCRDYVLQKSNYIRSEYYQRIDRALLAQSRIIYFAMRPFLCCNGTSRNTIFAYMPAHKRDSYHFRPWRIEECKKKKKLHRRH